MKKYTFFSLFAFLLTTGGNLFGQDYNDYNAPFFNGRLPSAKSEAMGRVQVSSYDGAFSAFYNPASIFLTKGLNSSFSYSSPYYMVRKANYNFYGLTYNFNKLGSISFSRFHFSYGEKFYMTSASDPADYSKSYTPTTSNYTLSYAKEFLSNFSIGINLNLYIDKYFNKSFKTYPVDIGLLKIISISHRNNNKQKLNFGASVKNVFGTRVSILDHKESLPIVLRLGSSYEVSFLKQDYLPNLFLFGMGFHLEYEDILKFKYKSGIKFGAEFSLFELLFLRLGYYSFNQDPSPSNGRDKLTDFTFGFGIQLPVNEFVKKEIPLTLYLDMTSLEQPSYIKGFDEWDNFTNYSIKIKWNL